MNISKPKSLLSNRICFFVVFSFLFLFADLSFAQESDSTVISTDENIPLTNLGVQGGVGYQKGLFGGLSVKWEWFYGTFEYGYNIFHSNHPSNISMSVGWLPSSTRDGDGLFVNFIGSSSNMFSSNSDGPVFASANIGWLSYQPKKVSYSILVGPGMKAERINGAEVKRNFFVNAEASIGYAF